ANRLRPHVPQACWHAGLSACRVVGELLVDGVLDPFLDADVLGEGGGLHVLVQRLQEADGQLAHLVGCQRGRVDEGILGASRRTGVGPGAGGEPVCGLGGHGQSTSRSSVVRSSKRNLLGSGTVPRSRPMETLAGMTVSNRPTPRSSRSEAKSAASLVRPSKRDRSTYVGTWEAVTSTVLQARSVSMKPGGVGTMMRSATFTAASTTLGSVGGVSMTVKSAVCL